MTCSQGAPGRWEGQDEYSGSQSLTKSRELYGRELFENIDKSIVDKVVMPGTEGKLPSVYKVVKGQIPRDLREALVEDFTEYERHEIYHRVDVYQAECDHVVPKALWIFGPPAVGKTTISHEKACDLFGWPDNAVTVDGSEFRAVHKGFQMVAQHGLRNQLLHEDGWKLLKGSGHMNVLKEEIVQLAIQNRQHLKIPETLANEERVHSMLKKLVEAGYELHAVCLWAPKSETEARGRPRGVKQGKAFSFKEYDRSSKNTLKFGKLWFDQIASRNPSYKSVMFHDSTVFPSRPVHFSEFEYLTNLNDEMADRHARSCKVEKRAHEKSDIAASEARIKGSAPGQVVQAALNAFMDGNHRPPSKAPSRARVTTETEPELLNSEELLRDWSLTHPDQVTELVYADRQKGQIEGFIAGLTFFAAALLVRYVAQMKRFR